MSRQRKLRMDIFHIIISHNASHRLVTTAGKSKHAVGISPEAEKFLENFIQRLQKSRTWLQYLRSLIKDLGVKEARLSRHLGTIRKFVNLFAQKCGKKVKAEKPRLYSLIHRQAKECVKRFGYWYFDGLGLVALAIRDILTDQLTTQAKA